MKQVLKKLFIFFFIFLILIFFIEIGGRFYIKILNSQNTGMNLKGKTYGILRTDKELGFSHTAHAYNLSRVSNNMGFLNVNDVVLPEKRNPKDVVFITYGGSSTYCYNLEQDEAWPIIFQKEMCGSKKKNELCKYSVFNNGHIMWSIGHIYKKVKGDLTIIKPDYIIIYSGINEYSNYEMLKLVDKIDVDKSIKNKKYGLTTKAYNWWWIKHNSIFEKIIHYKLLTPLIKRIKSLTENLNDQKIQNEKWYDLDRKNNFPIVFDNYVGVLKKLINLAEKHDTKVIFLVQSHGTDTKKNIFFTSFSQKAKEIANELGAIVIDTNEIKYEYKDDKKELYSETGVHYSIKGSNLVGKLLLTKLKEKEILTIN